MTIAELEALCQEAINNPCPEAKKLQKKLEGTINSFIGQVMRQDKRFKPEEVRKAIISRLNQELNEKEGK